MQETFRSTVELNIIFIIIAMGGRRKGGDKRGEAALFFFHGATWKKLLQSTV